MKIWPSFYCQELPDQNFCEIVELCKILEYLFFFFIRYLTKVRLMLGKMKLVKMTKQQFQWLVNHEINVYVTSICH